MSPPGGAERPPPALYARSVALSPAPDRLPALDPPGAARGDRDSGLHHRRGGGVGRPPALTAPDRPPAFRPARRRPAVDRRGVGRAPAPGQEQRLVPGGPDQPAAGPAGPR